MLAGNRGPTGRGNAARASRQLLNAIESVPPDAQSLSLHLQLLLSFLRCQWAALHMAPATRAYGDKPSEVTTASAASETGGALFTFLSDELQDSILSLAGKAIGTCRVVTVGATAKIRIVGLPGAALCVPIVDPDMGRPIGSLTILNSDASRTFSAEEQMLLVRSAPLFALHLLQERIATQSALLSASVASGGGGAGGSSDKMQRDVSGQAAKVVQELNVINADKLEKQRLEHRTGLASLEAKHAEEKKELEEALLEANGRCEKVEKESVVRMHKMLEGLELQHIAELDALREEFANRDPSAPPTIDGKRRTPSKGGGGGGEAPSGSSAPTTPNARGGDEAPRVALPPSAAESSMRATLLSEISALSKMVTDDPAVALELGLQAELQKRKQEYAELLGTTVGAAAPPAAVPIRSEEAAAVRIQAGVRGKQARVKLPPIARNANSLPPTTTTESTAAAAPATNPFAASSYEGFANPWRSQEEPSAASSATTKPFQPVPSNIAASKPMAVPFGGATTTSRNKPIALAKPMSAATAARPSAPIAMARPAGGSSSGASRPVASGKPIAMARTRAPPPSDRSEV